jgi:hypothetical protein
VSPEPPHPDFPGFDESRTVDLRQIGDNLRLTPARRLGFAPFLNGFKFVF